MNAPLRLAPKDWQEFRRGDTRIDVIDYFGAPADLDLDRVPAYTGSVEYPLTERIASDIRAHGYEWARSYHIGRGLADWEWRVLSANATKTTPRKKAYTGPAAPVVEATASLMEIARAWKPHRLDQSDLLRYFTRCNCKECTS